MKVYDYFMRKRFLKALVKYLAVSPTFEFVLYLVTIVQTYLMQLFYSNFRKIPLCVKFFFKDVLFPLTEI
jgi:hypothetical protein